MEKIIKHNGNTYKYDRPKQYGDFIEIKMITVTTDIDYSVENVFSIIKETVPTVIGDLAEDTRSYYIKGMNILFTKYYNLNLTEPLGQFFTHTSTVVLDNEDWKPQWEEWYDRYVFGLTLVIPNKDHVIQSSNKLENYLRIVNTQFPPIDDYSQTVTPTLNTELNGGSFSPILMYDISYVTQSPKDVDTVQDLWNDSFPFTYDQCLNRIKFFKSNFDINVTVSFVVGGIRLEVADFR